MSENSLHDTILITYNNNIEFLKKYHKEIFDKIELLESVLETSVYTQKYELEYKDTYFDVYQYINKSFLYNQDSYKYSKDIISKMTFDEVSDNFKPYRHFNFDDEYARKLENTDLLDDTLAGISPISHYVDNYLPEQRNTKIHKFVFFGIGLGLQIQEVQNKFNCKIYFISEPDLELFRLSLFTTSYDEIGKNSKLIFSIADTNDEFLKKCDIFLEERYVLNYNIKFNLFSEHASYLISMFKNKIVQQNFIVYDYKRRYRSNETPLMYIKDKYNFLNVRVNEERETILSKNPILLLASGPSISRNIQWLLSNHSKFIIVTVSANLHFLYENNIKPDVIIHIDEDKKSNIKDFSRVDMGFFKDSVVLVSSIIDTEVFKLFEKNQKFIIQALAKHYINLGRLFSPSVGEFSYALSLLYCAKEIYLLGLDYALDPETNQSHFGKHIDKVVHDNIDDDYKKEAISLDSEYSCIKGNFRKEVYTTARLRLSILKFNYYTSDLKTQNEKVYNLSDGAYLNDTIPLKIDDFKISKFLNLDKQNIKEAFLKDLLNNSKNQLDDYDKKILKRKLKNAKYIQKLIVHQSKKSVYNNENSFLKDFEELINNITKGEDKYDSAELNEILFEYARLVSHYIYSFCEYNFSKPNQFIYIKEINIIFTTQLLKIVDKYINLLKNI